MLNWLLAALSGLLLVFIHPRFDFVWLAPVAVAPIAFALAREPRLKRRFLLGYACGLVFWAGINYWIQFVMSVHGKLGPAGGWAAFVLFCFLRAVPLGLFALAARPLLSTRFAVPLTAALWVAMERIPWLFNYTWLLLGNAGIDMAIPMRLAPFTGVYGLSFVFAATGVALALIALRRPRAHTAWMLGVVLLFGL
ncbi:MAG TPA: hypothetical protein VHN20_01955, partial [Beijerinckiaceae bacterium]|nr:hypothetical protein [Beijerinckiaceae bacterium]